MKLTKGLAISALALSNTMGCGGSDGVINEGIPENCDSAGMIDHDAEVLTYRSEVEQHCADVRGDVRQEALTCVYGVSSDDEHLLTFETSCTDSGLDGVLDIVFDEQDELSDWNYCVSTGPKLDCVDT